MLHGFRNQTFNQSQSYDEYFDSSSYPYQEERYGQEEEDRQWDSGGFYGNKTTPTTTSVYQENHINRRRNSKLPETPVSKNDFYQQRKTKNTYNDEPYPSPPTPSTTRRRMPQIPTKRSASRQGSLNDYGEYYDECKTPENSSHRGASLPPTPTTTPKILARIAAHTKPSVSLPPTPGRQLPKPNLNHRSAKARRNNILKRTSSAECNDPEQLEDSYNYYMRPGAVSAQQMYNEDYNYAYQSIDNLPAQPEVPVSEVLTPVSTQYQTIPPVTYPSVSVNDQRTSIMSTISNAVKINGTAPVTTFQPLGTNYQSTEEYYYSAQEDRDYQENDIDYYEPKPLTTRKKKLGRRENSPLLQQNTDSLESRDDELKDSFETAVSSISSSFPPQRRGPYSMAGDTSLTNTTSLGPLDVPLAIKQLPQPNITVTTTVTTMQYNRDQTEIPKAIVSVNGSVRDNLDNTSIAANNTTMINHNSPSIQRNNSRILKQDSIDQRGYFNHQDSVDQTEYMEPQENYIKTDATDQYFNHQESIDSYTEDTATLTNGMSEEYNGKVGKESPVSVIHVETFEPSPADEEKRNSITQNNLMDPYHPNLQRPDPYAPVRRPSVDPYRPVSPSRRTSGDSYIPGSRKGSIVDAYGNSQRKNSSLEPYPVPMSRRTSVRHSPNQEMLKQESVDQMTPPDSVEEHDPEKKSVSFEDEEEVKPIRREITAKQRWHWAYNKIIMQLNVSTIIFYFYSVKVTCIIWVYLDITQGYCCFYIMFYF